MDIREYLRDHRLIMDGSMGTYYAGKVNQPGALSERANLTSPEVIEGIHREYIEAGARMIRTNTFAANRKVLNLDIEEQKNLIRIACQLAKRAAGREDEDSWEEQVSQKKKESIWIAGNVGPIGEDAGTEEEDILEEYKLLCDIFLEEGLDAIHFETFSSLKYIRSLVPYVREKNSKIFILVSCSVNKNGYTEAGISGARLLESFSTLEGIDACGFNCGVGSSHMEQLLSNMTFPENRYLYVAPNAGYPETIQNRMIFLDNETYFVRNMKQIAELGVELLGGCCGTTPEYIRYINNEIGTKRQKRARSHSVITSVEETIITDSNAFYQRFSKGKKVIAVELDPPYDADVDKIMECAYGLKSCGIDILTIADSPMGRSRVDSILMSIKIAEETGLMVMPHVCCRDRNMISMRASLLGAYVNGIRNLLLVTGDPVPGESRTSTTGVFDYNSIRLMEFVKELNVEHFIQEPICYGGALNYGRGSIEAVIKRMKQKIDGGAKYFLTQPIYSKEDVERLRYIRTQLDTKILCGIMPLVSYRNANFIKNEMTGINVPDEVVARYRPEMDKEEAEWVGAELAMEIMEMTADFADGYYFMLPFNRVSLMEKINL